MTFTVASEIGDIERRRDNGVVPRHATTAKNAVKWRYRNEADAVVSADAHDTPAKDDWREPRKLVRRRLVRQG